MALGATFSALEVVPLVLIGFEAYENLTLSRARPWVAAYRWPIYFFVAVAFWNLVGAGLFGFLINPPIALYYMQGLNTTPVHGHTALFGVYGMLGIGLMLFCLKGLTVHQTWRTGALAFAFWSINVGLALMVLLSLLPVGLMQTWASVEHGTWYARSAEFMQTPTMDTLRWLRVVGDTIFAVGVVALGWFVLGLEDRLVDRPRAGRRRPRIPSGGRGGPMNGRVAPFSGRQAGVSAAIIPRSGPNRGLIHMRLGRPLAPGVAVARAYCLDQGPVHGPARQLDPTETPDEIRRFESPAPPQPRSSTPGSPARPSGAISRTPTSSTRTGCCSPTRCWSKR